MTISRERAGLAVVLLLTAGAIAGLTVLQYRWNREASEATGVRLADALQLSMVNWHLDLFRNLSEVCLTIRMGADFSPDGDIDEFAKRVAEWRGIARYPGLVKNVYIVGPGKAGAATRTLRLDADRGVLVEAAPPQPLGTLAADLSVAPAHLPVATSPSSASAQLTESFYNIGAALRDWRFEPALPALVRPIGAAAGVDDHLRQWLVIELDDDVMSDLILPDLAHRYFQGTDGLDYEVAVVSGSTPRRVIYSSDPGFADQEVADADGRMDVFGRARDVGSRAPISIFHRTSDNRGPTAAVGITWFPLLRPMPTADDWQLVVRHRRGGSLGVFVAEMERRGLLLSFGAMCLLVLSLSMLVIVSVRAQRLARLQMDFVTAVSHELRTPLAIIGSAADNIASGVVDGKTQMQEYGSVIGDQANSLSNLVERVLLFAATRDGQQRSVLAPLPPVEIIDAALASTERLIRAAQFTIERDIPAHLPPILGDRMTAAQCVENLITNALKYSGDERWLGIRARVVDDFVEISVADRGIGIAAADLPHIFEPFYRSPDVRRAQIHGTGLGLALARQIAEMMGGSLTVTSQPARGSTFTLTLRVAKPTAEAAPGASGSPLFTGSLQQP
jgi:signal transduction histidine kinase